MTTQATKRFISSRRKHWSPQAIRLHFKDRVRDVFEDQWGVCAYLRAGWVIPASWATIVHVEHGDRDGVYTEWDLLALRLDEAIPDPG